MNSKLYTYALLKSLCNNGEDYIDSFWPLVVNVLPQDKTPVSLEYIQEKVEKKYGFEVPRHALSIISTRANRKDLLIKNDKKIALSNKGLNYILNLESEKEAECRINELLDEAQIFLNLKHNIDISKSKIREFIENIISENLELFEQFINPYSLNTKPLKNLSYRQEVCIMKYFFHIRKSNPYFYNTLKDIVCGSIISKIVHSERFSEITKRFEQIIVYFDSNFLLNLFGFGSKEYKIPAEELFKLLKSEKAFELKVFDFTIDEMINVLDNYQNEKNYYPYNIKICSIYSSMKAQEWTVADVKEFISKIDNELLKRGIKTITTDININNYQVRNLEYRSLLSKYKPDQGLKAQNHDLAAIDYIRKGRKEPVKRIEKCQAIFLTSDLKLAKFNYVEYNHKGKTISEAIPDSLLTNILWMKKPPFNDNIPLTSIMLMHSRQFYIDKNLWKSFYKNVMDLRDEGNIDDDAVSVLLYDKQIHETLIQKNYEENHVDLGKQFLLAKIEEAKKQREKEEEEEKERKFVDIIMNSKFDNMDKKLEEKNSMKYLIQPQVDENIVKKSIITNITNIIRDKQYRQKKVSIKLANVMIRIVSYFIILVILSFTAFLIPYFCKNWNALEPIICLISYCLLLGMIFLGIKWDPFKWRFLLEEKIANKIYSWRSQELKDIESILSSILQNDYIWKSQEELDKKELEQI